MAIKKVELTISTDTKTDLLNKSWLGLWSIKSKIDYAFTSRPYPLTSLTLQTCHYDNLINIIGITLIYQHAQTGAKYKLKSTKNFNWKTYIN